jgi:hypothetical protein
VVELVSGTGHCAVSKLPEVFPTILGWFDRTLTAARRRPASRLGYPAGQPAAVEPDKSSSRTGRDACSITVAAAR